ncbi:putative peptidase M15 [Magnetofaba australis IT-1]|uniref:Putative peptidase M15 n=2 Tax=Magnetofaba TaxID=1472292 RepID=A0A1Y2K4N7_9PROT|nr:putative peptidase M15 [Magnetofaba australis IT-1]
MDEMLKRVRDFNSAHPGDIYVERWRIGLLRRAHHRFDQMERVVGHANFHLLSFDEALKVANRYSKVGQFTAEEMDFLEEIFYRSADEYGFMGDKPVRNLTEAVPRREVAKVPYTGNYLYRGDAMRVYDKIRKEVGRKVVLTSGVRSVVKQFHLFLAKAVESDGNLSLASRSLAPPGYSFHGVGDFDVGQRGLGKLNFTVHFTQSEVFQGLAERGYLKLRYTRDNQLGVRFEPWHIKVVSA